jgi:hypothetical protein
MWRGLRLKIVVNTEREGQQKFKPSLMSFDFIFVCHSAAAEDRSC